VILLGASFAGAAATAEATAVGATAAEAATWRWPVRGEVVERFAVSPANPYARGQHRGIDIAAPRGAAVRAACAGRVRFAGNAGSFGRAVTISCGEYAVSYGHLAQIAVEPGETVRAGHRIGAVGTTGRGSSTGPHLHLGVRRTTDRNGYIDPLLLLPTGEPRSGPPPLPPTRPIAPRATPPRPSPATPSPAAVPGLPKAVLAGLALLAAGIPGLAIVTAGTARRRRQATRNRNVAIHNPLR
jgi:murein DD-endopeptidase MepM/ murein hydrolase activator NlpD